MRIGCRRYRGGQGGAPNSAAIIIQAGWPLTGKILDPYRHWIHPNCFKTFNRYNNRQMHVGHSEGRNLRAYWECGAIAAPCAGTSSTGPQDLLTLQTHYR